MLTLSYGYKVPQDGDKGSVFFDALEFNIGRQNGHSHNGTDAPKLTSAATVPTTALILSATWSDQGNGTFKQDVVIAGGMKFDECVISIRIEDPGQPLHGHVIHPSIEKKSGTEYAYTLYINDPTLTLRAVYAS